MSRLIDADKFSAISYIEKSKDFTEGVEFVVNMIDNAPTVQAIPIEVLQEIRQEITNLVKTYPFIDHKDTYVKEDEVLVILDRI